MTTDWQKENLAWAITYSTEGIKAALLLNGGAGAALMTLMGTLEAKGDKALVSVHVAMVKDALHSFGMGLLAAAATFVIAYLAQVFFAATATAQRRWWEIIAGITRVAGLATVATSLWFFYKGVDAATSAFLARIVI